MASLTPRQREFLQELAVLVNREQRPIHYSELAARMGVGPLSAYDMLKSLERKGLVAAVYVLSPHRRGPGRSQIFFNLTQDGRSALTVAHEDAEAGEWRHLKRRILRRLREAAPSGYGELMRDLLEHLPDSRRPLAFCAHMTVALLVNLARAGARMRDSQAAEALADLTTRGEAGLGTLAGLSLGVVLQSDPDRRQLEYLYQQTRRYQAAIHTLSEEGRRRLAELLREAIPLVVQGRPLA
ncbi:MAG: hypothetical protein Kow0047_03510 [Anaerolineae bacterium]